MKTIIFPFFSFAMMFLGAGFISGSIVHLGEGTNAWDLTILFSGVLFFIIGSYLQEVIYNKKSLKEGGAIKFLFFSFLLSLGVGMASGGIQHFVDTPAYSSYLIPIGLLLGVVAYTFKNNISLPKAHWGMLSISILIFSFGTWIILSNAAKHISLPSGHTHSESVNIEIINAQVSDEKPTLEEPSHHH